MRITLFIPTSGVENNHPTEWFAQRLDESLAYYHKHTGDEITFIVSGRWNKAEVEYLLPESEVGRRYIKSKIPDARVLIEDISLETGGNIAFGKPLIASTNPEEIVIFCSQVHVPRIKYLTSKIFNPKWDIKFLPVQDSLSENSRAQQKEPKALAMFQKLLDGVQDGDDKSAREIFLYHTPFYFKGIIDDQQFFDEHWPGGFEDFIEKRLSIDNQ